MRQDSLTVPTIPTTTAFIMKMQRFVVQLLNVTKLIFVLLEVQITLKEELKCALVEDGALYVMTCGE